MNGTPSGLHVLAYFSMILNGISAFVRRYKNARLDLMESQRKPSEPINIKNSHVIVQRV